MYVCTITRHLIIMPSKLKHKRHGEGFHGYALLRNLDGNLIRLLGGRVCSLIIIIIKPVIILQGPRQAICCSWATRKSDDPDVAPYQMFVQSDREDLEEEEEVDGRRFGLSYIPVWLR